MRILICAVNISFQSLALCHAPDKVGGGAVLLLLPAGRLPRATAPPLVADVGGQRHLQLGPLAQPRVAVARVAPRAQPPWPHLQ